MRALLLLALMLLGPAPAASQNPPAPSPVEKEKPQRVSVVQPIQGTALKQVLPDYPPEAKQARIGGNVKVEVVIAEDGRVKSAKVLSGIHMLVEAAVEAAQQWQYQPELVDGKLAERTAILEFVFTPPTETELISESVSDAQAALGKAPEKPESHLQMGMALRMKADYRGAVASFRRALELDPNHSEAREALIQTLLNYTYDLDSAAAEMRLAVARNPTDADLHRGLADLLLRLDDLDGAIVELRELVRLAPGTRNGYQMLGMALLRKLGPDRAAAEIRQWVQLSPDPAKTYAQIGEGWIMLGRSQATLRLLEEGLSRYPDDQELRSMVDLVRQGRSAVACAQGRLNDWRNQQPENIVPQVGLAAIHYVLNDDLEGGLKIFRDSLRGKGRVPRAVFARDLAEALAQAGGTNFAIREFQKLCQVRPDLDSLHAGLAWLLLRRGRLDEALYAAQYAAALNPHNVEAHEIAATVLRARGELDAAARETAAAKQNRQQASGSEIELLSGIEEALKRCFEPLEKAGQSDRDPATAQEYSAVGSLRTLNTAAVTYSATYGGFPPSLANLGSGGSGAPASAQAADLIDPVLAGGTKNGYVFIYTTGESDDKGNILSYTITADPIEFGKSAQRFFFTDQSGVIRFSTRGRATVADEPIS